MYAVLPDELKILDDLADDLMKQPWPSRDKDRRIHSALFDRAQDDPPNYSGDLNAAVALIPHGWWWNVSHLEASVCPNRPEPDIPISNATDYRFNGRPVSYSHHIWGHRDVLPLALCAALIRSRCGMKAKAAAKRDDRMYIIQTGDGPMLVDRDGTLKEMPPRAWLSEDGRLIAHKDAFPQYEYDEPPPEDDE